MRPLEMGLLKHWTSCAGHLFHWLLHLIWNLCCLVASPLRVGSPWKQPSGSFSPFPYLVHSKQTLLLWFTSGLCTPPHPSTRLQPQPSTFNPPGMGQTPVVLVHSVLREPDFSKPFVRFEIKKVQPGEGGRRENATGHQLFFPKCLFFYLKSWGLGGECFSKGHKAI